MPNEKETQSPLLRDTLSMAERTLLAQLTHMPGYKVLTKLMDAFCTESTEQVIKTDPEIPDYQRILATRQQTSRATHAFCAGLLKSIDWHATQAMVEHKQEKSEAEDVVAKRFGVHVVKPQDKK